MWVYLFGQGILFFPVAGRAELTIGCYLWRLFAVNEYL